MSPMTSRGSSLPRVLFACALGAVAFLLVGCSDGESSPPFMIMENTSTTTSTLTMTALTATSTSSSTITVTQESVALDGRKSSCGDSSDNHIMNEQEAEEILELHNKYRCAVGTPPLQWSGELQCQTQRAQETMSEQQQAFAHSPSYSLPIEAGENLAEGGGAQLTVDMWFAEYTDTGRNGHYTAMIWKSTTKLGCSRASGIIRCQYADSAPNIGDASFGSANVPYFAGARASFDTCGVDIFHIQAQVKKFMGWGWLNPDPELAASLGLGLGDSSDWVAISESAACASNSEGISSFYHACGYPTLRSCKLKCESQFGCRAIDFFGDTKYCHLYATACTSPGSQSSGASSYKRAGADDGAAAYSPGLTDTNSCQEKAKITDPAECQEAAGQLGLLWNKEVNAAGFPGGCLQYMSKVWFNHNSGGNQATSTPICKEAGPTTAPMPSWPVTVSEKYCHNYLDPPGSKPGISDLSGCQSVCSEHAECIGVSYTTAYGGTYCYLCADDNLTRWDALDFYRNPFKQVCQDVQPPDFWDDPTCEAQLANTDTCERRRSGEVKDGLCDKTCGVCGAASDGS